MTQTPVLSPKQASLQSGDEDEWQDVEDDPESLQDQIPPVQQNKQNTEANLPPIPPIPLSYLTCSKGGFHQNERLSLVCLQDECKNDPTLCVICLEEDHFGHKVSSLRFLAQASRKKAIVNDINSASIQSVKEIITKSKDTLKAKCSSIKQQVFQLIKETKEGINQIYSKMDHQLQLKSEGMKIIEFLNEIQNNSVKTNDEFFEFIKNLKEGVPDDWEQNEDEDVGQSEDQIKNTIMDVKENLDKRMDVVQKSLTQTFKNFITYINTLQSTGIIMPPTQLQFSEDLKHPDIELVSSTLVRSITNQIATETYRFALLGPSLEQFGLRANKFSFLIKQNTKDWIAVGIAHRKTIENESFNFNYSQMNHGAYLISSNGGSWSSIDQNQNNVVTCFPFYQDDIINVEYDPINMKVNFQKQITQEKHSLEFIIEKDNPLHLCVLFYYNDDEVEYLKKEKQ